MEGTKRHWTSAPLLRFRRCTKGVTAVEFALVAFPFFLVLASILEGGVMLFTQHSIQNALQDASRQLSTRQVLNSEDFVESLCASASVQDCATRININVMSAANFVTLSNQFLNPLAVGPGTTVFDAGAAGSAVVAVVTYDWEFIFPLMEVFGNVPGSAIRRLVAVAAFQNEP